jgi:hypothetical protein
MPEMGIKGAGWAALIGRLIELSIILVYVLFIDKKLKIRLKQLFAFDFSYIKDFIRVSLPLVLSGALWGFAQTVQMAILGHMSATVIAAKQRSHDGLRVYFCGSRSLLREQCVGDNRQDHRRKAPGYDKAIHGYPACGFLFHRPYFGSIDFFPKICDN